ncbi:laccase [Suillus subluteus]|nr:laccase [Suillus subluteus]
MAQKHDNFSINVVNQLHDEDMPLSTSVHWHGIYQKKTNWADGTSFTQCPIPPNGSFLHQFSAPNQTGTIGDGLRGPIVIYDPDDPHKDLYDVDDESTVLTLSDWFHEPTTVLDKVIGPVTDNSTLINGLGRYPGGPMSPLSVINVEQGKRYRFRILGLSSDGVETSLSLWIYFRCSLASATVVVQANQPVANYWVRAQPNIGNTTFVDGLNQAILRYKGAPDEDPTSSAGPSVLPFNEALLASLMGIPAPGVPEIGKADVNINLVAGNVNGLFTINNVTYHNPPTPVCYKCSAGLNILRICCRMERIRASTEQVVEITLPNTGLAPGGPHPMHLHGHKFAVMGNGDNVTFRFVTDNAGPWFFHCHIDFHLNNGFAAVMAEARDQLPIVAASIPNTWASLCPTTDDPYTESNGIFNTTLNMIIATSGLQTITITHVSSTS